MIYEIREVQVILDSILSVTECHGYLDDNIVTYCDVGKLISMLISFKNAFFELERN